MEKLLLSFDINILKYKSLNKVFKHISYEVSVFNGQHLYNADKWLSILFESNTTKGNYFVLEQLDELTFMFGQKLGNSYARFGIINKVNLV